MIKPVGSDELQPRFVYDSEQHHALMHEAESLPSVVISSQAAGNAVMMGAASGARCPYFERPAPAAPPARRRLGPQGLQ